MWLYRWTAAVVNHGSYATKQKNWNLYTQMCQTRYDAYDMAWAEWRESEPSLRGGA